jgi:hypothetical protein
MRFGLDFLYAVPEAAVTNVCIDPPSVIAPARRPKRGEGVCSCKRAIRRSQRKRPTEVGFSGADLEGPWLAAPANSPFGDEPRVIGSLWSSSAEGKKIVRFRVGPSQAERDIRYATPHILKNIECGCRRA